MKAGHSTHEESGSPTKKALILEAAEDLGKPRFTPAEIEQIRRKLIAQLGAQGKTSADYIVSVLEEAEMCIVRLDELFRKFQHEHERAGAERVREVARLGRRRAEMISRNHKVDAAKRAAKEEIAHWFGIWLETPDAFFDWLEVRKQSPDFLKKFPNSGLEAE